MTILITRPLAAAKRTEQSFNETGFATWIDPVLTIIPLSLNITIDAYDAIITTSVAGVESLAAITTNRIIPIFCAGAASAAIARELGFTSIFYPTEPGGIGLIPLIKQSPFKRFAYIRGETIKIDIAIALSDIPNLFVDSYVAYKAIPTAAWTDKTIALFHSHKITAITFYSEHSARVTLDLLRAHNLLSYTPSITALCLSDSIAEVIYGIIWKEIKITAS